MNPLDEQSNSVIATVSAKVQDPFWVIKRQFCYVKARYRGMAKNRARSPRCSHLATRSMSEGGG